MRNQLLFAFLLVGCGGARVSPSDSSGDSDNLTSVGGAPYQIEWDGYVYAAPDTNDAALQAAVAKQIKSSLGPLRQIGIGISDRGALHNLDPAGFTRQALTIVKGDGSTQPVQRVRYHYRDTALLAKGTPPANAANLTLLFGDYTNEAAAQALQPACADEPTDGDSLWYHFSPAQSGCAALINAEQTTIGADTAKLTSPGSQIAASDAQRRFVTVRTKLTPGPVAPVLYPEYDRLWGFGSDRQKLILYAFVGVEHDERDSHDISAAEYQRLLKTLRARFPKLSCFYTSPSDWLLDFYIDGKKLDGISWDDVANWMIDDSGYPAAVGSDPAKIESLRQQVITHFSERWIYWQMPVTVTRGGESRQMTVELRTFWGKEDGDPDSRQHAIWRYLEAFWYGDVFAYSGHSHFGHGPLEPTNYVQGNFPDRYQVFLFNSCLSFNYYDLDFINMHPGGSRNLEVVSNGLAAYWNGMGESTARYLIGLIDGSSQSYPQLLESMKISDPWGRAGYEPMRGINGELDNVFKPSNLTVTPN